MKQNQWRKKAHGVISIGNQEPAFKSPFSAVIEEALNSSSIEFWQHMGNVYQQSSLETQFIEHWLWGNPLPSTYQDSRLSEKKQVFCIIHIISTNSLDTMKALISKGMVRTLPQSNFLETSQGPTEQAGLSKYSSHRCYVHYFLHATL